MNIADKSTLDVVKTTSDSFGEYIGTKLNSASYLYYLPLGVRILCDKTKTIVTQYSGTISELSNGYQTTQVGYVSIASADGNVNNLMYSLN